METISVDAGNGMTNAVMAQKRGYKSIAFPSVRASTSGDSLGLGEQFEMNYEYVEWGGHKYLVGDDVFISRKAVERHQGAFRYGDEFWLFLIAYSLGKLVPKGGEIDLTVFAPPGMYYDAKNAIENRMKEIKHRVAIKFKGDKKPRIFTIESLTIHPEGLGALLVFALDKNGEQIESDLLDGDNVVLDSGMYTLDALQISNGQFNPESLSSATWESGGIRANILEPVLRTVKKAGDDFELMTVDDIDRVLRQGLETGDYMLRSGASQVDIKPAIDKYSERFAQWIANNIIDGVFNSLRGIKYLILVGGGAVLIAKYLKQWYGEKLLDASKHKQVKGINEVDMNAVGGIRLAMMKMRTK